jgi:hypothetical protein
MEENIHAFSNFGTKMGVGDQLHMRRLDQNFVMSLPFILLSTKQF